VIDRGRDRRRVDIQLFARQRVPGRRKQVLDADQADQSLATADRNILDALIGGRQDCQQSNGSARIRRDAWYVAADELL
jgi:hypothetical protein